MRSSFKAGWFTMVALIPGMGIAGDFVPNSVPVDNPLALVLLGAAAALLGGVFLRSRRK
ncbi:MAG: LPXTG cell wall anchor domain-containing protein [Chromatiales bacterium]|nr:LPXTG cell wall anchor domain-containing protein [Chromatiales bacterium]